MVRTDVLAKPDGQKFAKALAGAWYELLGLMSAKSPGTDKILAAIAEGNTAYESRFDRVFLIRAAGRTREPDESARHLELLARGPSHAPTSPRRRELLERLGPALLDEISPLPDPDQDSRLPG